MAFQKQIPNTPAHVKAMLTLSARIMQKVNAACDAVDAAVAVQKTDPGNTRNAEDAAQWRDLQHAQALIHQVATRQKGDYAEWSKTKASSYAS
jgi:hypothetical protein